ncbi:MAG: proteasome-activating nucleotidase [Methanophagales archaeon]|nr:proteasome-activating nucleotidase [Methanophagales archaeon]RLG32101.1 MAG: proteasome-activating nucleotidase [Methanosarcinales archaeon]
MKAGSSGVSYGDDYSRYLVDKMRQLEEANYLLKEKLKKIEQDGRYYEGMRIRYEREIKKLRTEIEKLCAPPLIIGTVVDIIDDRRMVVRSSTGPRFVVNYAKFIDPKEAVPGAQVGLNQQSLAVVSVLPSAKDPSVHGMEVIESPDVDYDMIGGLNEQIEEIREVVELPLTAPERFERVGVEPPKAVLLIGLPGTGKTLLAKAVANRTSATFIRVVGSELVQKYIGEGARLVREIFALAKEKAPSILFIDELDAVGTRRVEDGTSGEREVQRTMMQLLAEIDGFNPRGDVRIIGATNRPDILDPALLRPGRFDRIIEIPLPDKEARKEIFMIHTAKMKLKKDVNLDILAALTENATGADIKAIATEAGMFAVKRNKKAIAMEEFEQAIKKILGNEQRSYVNAKEMAVMFA